MADYQNQQWWCILCKDDKPRDWNAHWRHMEIHRAQQIASQKRYMSRLLKKVDESSHQFSVAVAIEASNAEYEAAISEIQVPTAHDIRKAADRARKAYVQSYNDKLMEIVVQKLSK